MKKKKPTKRLPPPPLPLNELLHIRFYNPEFYTQECIELEIIPCMVHLELLIKMTGKKKSYAGIELDILSIALRLCEHLEFLTFYDKRMARLVIESIEMFLGLHLDRNKAFA